jgi:hypothetical protein
VAVARAIHYSNRGAALYFNYRTKINEKWDNPQWKRRYGYRVDYGDEKGTCQVSI